MRVGVGAMKAPLIRAGWSLRSAAASALAWMRRWLDRQREVYGSFWRGWQVGFPCGCVAVVAGQELVRWLFG